MPAPWRYAEHFAVFPYPTKKFIQEVKKEYGYCE
jgi:hypothetical protein